MCEPDSDVVKWVLNFLDVDQIFSSTYYGDSNQHDVNVCHEQYNNGGSSYEENEFNNVQNDEMYELLDLSNTDGTELSNPDEHLQTSNDTQHWYNPSPDNYYYGNLFSKFNTKSPFIYSGDEYSYNLEMTDESELDGEVGKRLTEIVPVPHIPKVNGDIPSVDEATSDHQN
ncbi:hypothetical protein L2E82_07524 [Cichorium intybus]|uniref:Uncharacterized protein n=1 Tax=Cichorium intybus TaxID=13427 RepID=A0ACB9G545_CICIN|nr:hypothetical protein L2E82_07524 [Cichorium intybus]